MKIKTTYEKFLNVFAPLARAWVARDKANANTKLGYAISQKMEPRMKAAVRDFESAREDISIDECEVDERGIILIDQGQYRFTKQSIKKRNKRVQDLLMVTPIEVEAHLAGGGALAAVDSIELTELEREAFVGFVLTREQADSMTPADDEKPPVEVDQSDPLGLFPLLSRTGAPQAEIAEAIAI